MDRVRHQTERLLNLLIALRSAHGWIDRSTLRRTIDDYRAQRDDVAFDRMFSRDKELLRELGIEISTTDWTDADTGETAYGYRITEDDYALPQIVLTPEEAAVLSVAQTVFSGTELGPETSSAVNKLRGLGLDLSAPEHREVPQARIASKLFATFVAALGDRQPVEFDYRRPGGALTRRRLEPYALLTRGDRVYAVGRDIDRDAVRTFRLSRIAGSVTSMRSRAAGDYSIPTGFRAADYFAPDQEQTATETARLQIEPGRADPLRRAGHPGGTDGTLVDIDYSDVDEFVSQLLTYAPAVVPLAPAEVVSAFERTASQTAGSLDLVTGEGASHG